MADTTTRKEGRGFRPSAALLIVLVLIVAAVIMFTRDHDQVDDKREPSPTPTNENVHEIAP